MVYSKLPLLWAAILCCVANAEPLPAGTSRVLLNASSLTTSLQQQDVFTPSPTTLPSSSSSSISISSPVTVSQSSSPTTSTASCGTCVWGPLVPPPIPSSNTSTPQISASDGGSRPSSSSFASTMTVQTSGGEIGSQTSLSSTLATSTVIFPSDGKGGATAPGVPSKSTGRPVVEPPASAPTVVGLTTLSSVSIGPGAPSPLSIANTTVSDTISTQLSPSIATVNPSAQLNTSSTTPLSSKYHNSTSTRSHSAHNITTLYHTSSPHTKSTHTTTTSHHHHNTSTTCTPYTPGETITIWSIVPNTNTITITLTANQSNTYTKTPEFTPPIPACTPKSESSASASTINPFAPYSTRPATTSTLAGVGVTPPAIGPHYSSAPVASSETETSALNFITPPVTTAIITSKNPVTQFTTVTPPQFPGSIKTDKQSVQVTSASSKSTVLWTPLVPPPPPPVTTPTPETGSGGSGNGNAPGSGFTASPSTVNVGGVTVVVSPSSVAIGGQTVGHLPPGSTTVVTQGGQTFTVNPSQVIGPGTVIAIPTSSNGGVFMESPSPTVVDGVSVSVGNGVAVVGGSTYAIGAGAPETTIVANKETISIGPGGVGIADVTITPPAVLPTNVVLFGGEVFTVVGASVAIFDGSSITFTGGAPETTVFNGDTITIGPEGIIDGTSTLGGAAHPTGTQYGIAGGIQVSEIGSTIAVIDGTTLTVGPDATQTTATIDGKTITATTSGLIIDGSTTLKYPFNPTTQEITAGGITFSEIGSSLVDIGGTTFTIGPGATPTTDVYDGQTISIGPGGIGFATTTITSFTSSPTTATASGKKKNGGAILGPPFGILGACIALGVGLIV